MIRFLFYVVAAFFLYQGVVYLINVNKQDVAQTALDAKDVIGTEIEDSETLRQAKDVVSDSVDTLRDALRR